MRDYQPVTVGAEYGKTPVLFLDAAATYDALTEAASLRLDSARCLMDAADNRLTSQGVNHV